MILTINREPYQPTYTMGSLVVDELQLHTLERPWIENPAGPGGMPQRSCVPSGMYALKPHDSPKHPGSYQLVNVQLGVYQNPDDVTQTDWGRSEILIHSANSVEELLGCIAVGLTAEPGHVWSSKEAMALLRGKLGRNETHRLIIKGAT